MVRASLTNREMRGMRGMWFDFAHQPGNEGDEGAGEAGGEELITNAHLP
ncbi:hypothetical protein [Nostoc sp.]